MLSDVAWNNLPSAPFPPSPPRFFFMERDLAAMDSLGQRAEDRVGSRAAGVTGKGQKISANSQCTFKAKLLYSYTAPSLHLPFAPKRRKAVLTG